jgi:GT2 family glycosyltransferase
VDGDCEVQQGWIERGARFLEEHGDVAVVCGRLRECHPERSIYNRLCDIEWDVPAGETKCSGGNAMVRAEAFEKAGGFRGGMIAGEEPELCVRLRSAGWRVWRMDEPMALHDANMTRFGQWWKRNKRAGYGFALGSWLHGAAPERHWRRESLSAWTWGLGIPLATAAAAVLIDPLALLILAIYPAQVARIALRDSRTVPSRGPANWWRALFLVVGKFPETVGQLMFVADRFRGRTPSLIEYK